MKRGSKTEWGAKWCNCRGEMVETVPFELSVTFVGFLILKFFVLFGTQTARWESKKPQCCTTQETSEFVTSPARIAPNWERKARACVSVQRLPFMSAVK